MLDGTDRLAAEPGIVGLVDSHGRVALLGEVVSRYQGGVLLEVVVRIGVELSSKMGLRSDDSLLSGLILPDVIS